MVYISIVLHFFFNPCEPSLSIFSPKFMFQSIFSKNLFFPFQAFKSTSMAPKRKLTRSSIKCEKRESSTSQGLETPNPSIPSSLTVVEVPKSWFENHMAFRKQINVFKRHFVSFVETLDYNFFLFEDIEIISTFIESTAGKLLDPGIVSYFTLVKIFYCNLSFINLDGFPALKSYVKAQEILITKILIIKMFIFSKHVDESTPNLIAFENTKDMFFCLLTLIFLLQES